MSTADAVGIGVGIESDLCAGFALVRAGRGRLAQPNLLRRPGFSR